MDETASRVILSAPIQVKQEKMEPQVQLEDDEAISDAESAVRDSLAIGIVAMEDTEIVPHRGFTFRGILRMPAR